jgi:hypothetical protein
MTLFDTFSVLADASAQLINRDWAGLKESMKKAGELSGSNWVNNFIAAKDEVFKNTPFLGPTSWQQSLIDSGLLVGAGFGSSVMTGFQTAVGMTAGGVLVQPKFKFTPIGPGQMEVGGGGLYSSGVGMVDGLTAGFNSQFPVSQDIWLLEAQKYASELDQYYLIKSPSGLMQQKGVDIVLGLMFGMQSQWSVLMLWWQSAITELSKKIIITLDVQSPSKVMAGIGENIMLGLAKGIQSAGNTPWLAVRNTPLFAYARGGGNTANNTYITNKNYNLGGVNTTRPSTSVIRDFELMRLME